MILVFLLPLGAFLCYLLFYYEPNIEVTRTKSVLLWYDTVRGGIRVREYVKLFTLP